ncbi:MAG: polysaccharide pyruvyl transferase family protein [Planctomycetaceae bacterium]|jgi:hypothetical protein|nr:polysaccharide pyruvyl transferase family protein [Planctomycetaceae bacterium]MBT6155424.1 polysaccharide pyruvyl transferase family protein [Planctomycetaceae bacterium]MBT6485512.1 polysaccharide pyruvyl transferase family protein [Planctomycetaceae bacterium]
MSTYGLITPCIRPSERNPGSQFITDGIRWLIREIDSSARFLPVDLLAHDPDGWSLIEEQADAIIVCGNPRFNTNPDGVYCDLGVWQSILDASDSGIPFIEAWLGSAHPFPLVDPTEMAHAILRVNKTHAILSHQRRAKLRITRDRVTQNVLQQADIRSTLLPCSTWWAAAWHNVLPRTKDKHCITLRKMPGHPWIIDLALELQRHWEKDRPTFIVTHSLEDHRWVAARRNVPRLLCLPDPESLLQFYAEVDRLLSLRIHASIPALSLGAKVCNLSMDSRSLTVDEFGVESVAFTKFQDPTFEPACTSCTVTPDLQQALDVLRRAVC